jgi:hypothetical protein
MKAILIDPKTRTVSEIELPDGPTFEHVYKLIGDGCDAVDVVRLPGSGNEVMYVQEEGMLKLEHDKDGNCTSEFFILESPSGQPMQLIVGRGIILACDRGGRDKSTSLKADVMREYVRWLKPEHKDKAVETVDKIVSLTTAYTSIEELEAAGREYHGTIRGLAKYCEQGANQGNR